MGEEDRDPTCMSRMLARHESTGVKVTIKVLDYCNMRTESSSREAPPPPPPAEAVAMRCLPRHPSLVGLEGLVWHKAEKCFKRSRSTGCCQRTGPQG